MKKKTNDDFRKQKDIRIVRCFVYEGIGGDCISLTITDKITGKVYAGNLSKIYNKIEGYRKNANK